MTRCFHHQALDAAGAPIGEAVTERRTMLGYGDLIVDMRSFDRVRTACGVPAIFDGTHSVQQPGGQGGASGGQREYAPVMARCAIATGCAGLFIETHPDPDTAPSDGPNMIPLKEMEKLLSQLKALDTVVKA